MPSSLHIEVARYAAERGIDELWCVGPHSRSNKWRHFCDKAINATALAFDNNAAIIAALPQHVTPATTLVKGSRSAGLEIVVAALCDASLSTINRAGRALTCCMH